MSIERIQISDFRAFPALAPADIVLDGCNMLAYGENGSGKSSIYRALRGLFSSSAQDIMPLHNVFTDPPQPSVRVTLTDKTEYHWSAAGHPTADIQDVARKSAFLSHTRLIEMNTGATPNDKPELFHVAVAHLIADFEATVTGGAKRNVGELWQAVTNAFSRTEQYAGGSGQRRPKNFVAVLQTALDEFNDGMGQAITALEGQAKPLLRRLVDVLTQDALELVGFTFYGVNYDAERKTLRNVTLTANVNFRDHTPPAHQSFLNEGRQSALAIAIYLAGRMACVPTTDDALRLLVFDDLLISLDHSHRRPVLEVIATEFKDWQIILLTHDRFWFEMAREQLLGKPWKCVEIYESVDGDGLLRPSVWNSSENLVDETLKQAKRFLDENPPQPAAAANYARTACELALRRYCRNHNILFAYADDPQKIKLDDLLKKAAAHAAPDAGRKAAIGGLNQHKKLILNPLSHNPTQPIVKADVQAAITAVKALVTACSTKKKSVTAVFSSSRFPLRQR
ncbi:MAG: hypothetical protein CFE35_17405 [Novosphingobium sp. PASSN1]|nr:MAG: hypothetical protein CFE35_17405 [Novosphingobium sp. PASSN1]